MCCQGACYHMEQRCTAVIVDKDGGMVSLELVETD